MAGAGSSTSKLNLDPTGKRALFDAPVASAADRIATGRQAEGKAALFSSGPRRPGTVLVECEGCATRTRISLVRLALTFALGTIWAPLLHRDHPQWMVCPACNQRRWCHIGWRD
jgi:hypothetical protein